MMSTTRIPVSEENAGSDLPFVAYFCYLLSEDVFVRPEMYKLDMLDN